MLSEVPEGWRPTKLGDITDIKTGGTPSRKEDSFWGGEIYWMSSGEVWKKRVFDTKEKITEAALSRSAAKMLPKGSVMIALNGQGKTRGAAAILERDMTCNQSLAAVVPSEKHDNYFMLYFIESQYQNLRNITGDNARNGLNLGLLKSYELVLPPINEQHRIAQILSSVDASIQATQAVIEQAERVKRGLMEQLLTGGLGSEAIERGEVPEGYEAKTLGELLKGIDGGVSVNSQSEPASLEGKGILKTSCVSNSFFDASENKVVPDEKEIQRLREHVQAETIIFSRMNTPKLVGANAFVLMSHENLFLPDRLWALKPVSKVKPRWLGFYMSYLFSSGVFEALGTGTSDSMKNISKSKLKDVSIAVPSEVEQARVAEILSDVDDFIMKQKAIVEQQTRTKRGLMDDLLTGTVRTV